ncbi:MAG: hypothetical protein PHY09_06750 [Desulfuromonadaceae bacterium]|nr:hypothetical protein [Desulfuromonadaceae bacterium]MDD5104781.1 hypothetical protein [Desulfuromonadaceae bacterium]
MAKKIISSTGLKNVEKNQTSGFVGCAEMLTKENTTLVERQNQISSETVHEHVVIVFRNHKIISSLVTALYYYHQDSANAALPKSFNDQCIKYLDGLCFGNDLMLEGLVDDLNKIEQTAKSI